MKQILKLVFLLVLGQTALAQAPSNYTNINGRYRWIAGMFDSTFHIPKGTTPSLRTGGSTNAGGLFYNTGDSSVYTYTGTQWIKVRGSINPSDTTNKYVTQVYKKNASDSVFYVKGGNHLFAFIDSVGSPGGGGGGKVYYFNGGVSMGTFGGFAMYELGDTANTGAAANFTRSTTGNIANFITDPGKPGLLQIPAGVWSVDAWLSESGGGANHAEIWIEVEKWDGSTITTIATSPIEQITEGATPNLYSWSVSIPTTSLTVTDRIIIQFYISNTNGKTVTLYTQNGYVGEVHTTFTTGIGAINGLTAPAQYLVTGTSGTDFNISSATATHTFNLPTASATNRGALSSADWTTFNNKGSVSSVATNNGTGITGGTITTTGTLAIDTLLISTRAWRQKGIDSVASLVTGGYVPNSRTITINGTTQDLSANRTYNVGTVTSVATNTGTGITGGTFTTSGTIAADTLLLSTRAWRQKGIDSVASLINTRISGTTNYIPKFTSSSAIGNSVIYESGGNVGIGTTSVSSAFSGSAKVLAIVDNTTANVSSFRAYGGSSVTSIEMYGSGGEVGLFGSTAHPMVFYTNSTERMRITSGGNLGLGTSSPAYKFDVQVASNKHWAIAASSTGEASFRAGNDGYAAFAIGEIDASTLRLNSQSGGNVGIGLTNPGSYNNSANRLVVGGTADAGITIVGDPSEGSSNLYLAEGTTGDQAYRGFLSYSHSNDYLTIGTAGTTRMTLSPSGNLGLGVTPNAWGAGQVAFEYGTLGTLVSTGSAVSLQNNSYNNGTNNIRKVIGEASSYTQSGGAHIWQTAASGSTGSTISFSEVMRLTSGGNLGLGVTPSAWSTGKAFEVGALGNSLWGIGGGDIMLGSNFYYNTDFKYAASNYATGYRQQDGVHKWLISSSGSANATISFTQAMTLDASGRLGIGTSAPTARLHAYGTETSPSLTTNTGIFTVHSTSTVQLNIGGNNSAPYPIWLQTRDASGGSNSYPLLLNPLGGNVGIGTSAPGNRLHVYSTGAELLRLEYSGATGGNYIQLKNSSGDLGYFGYGSTGSDQMTIFQGKNADLAIFTNSAERMRITSGGNVGIGTNSPRSGGGYTYLGINSTTGGVLDLMVNGTTTGSLYSDATGTTLISQSTTLPLSFWTNSSERMRITSGGDVGIGTSSPSSRLHIASTADVGITLSSSAAAYTSFINFNVAGGGTAVIRNLGTTQPLLFELNSAERMRITSAGEVYIAGTTDQGAYNLQVNGTGVWGAGAYVNGSDSALKQNIQPLDNSLDLVKQMKPVTYTYKESYSKDTSVQTGFIAQDLQVLLKDKNYLNGIVKDGTYLSVAYQNLIPLLVKAIQEQQLQIEELKTKIK